MNVSRVLHTTLPVPVTTLLPFKNYGYSRITKESNRESRLVYHIRSSSIGVLTFLVGPENPFHNLRLPPLSGALGAGLAIFSRYPFISAAIHPYALNGTPLDVAGGDWFVGKAAAHATILHPVLGQVELFNTHVRPIIISYFYFILKEDQSRCY